MSNANGPAALQLMLDKLISIENDAEWEKADKLICAWDAERAQAAADRAALADVRMAHTALNTLFDDAMRERDDLRVKLEEAYKALEVIGTRKDTAEAALAQALALLAEIESEAREQIAAPNTNAAQMVVSEAVADTCRRIAAALSGGAR